METNRLHQFCVIAETGNLRKAAEMLGISHGGLSKSLKVLEEEVGLELVIPSGRGLAVTDEGREFHARAKAFLSQLDSLTAKSSQKSRELRVGTFEVFSTYFLAQVLAADLKETPVSL